MRNDAHRGALILFGISYHETLRDESAVDFRFSVQNYRETLIEGFLNQGGGVDVFLCTAASEATAQLLNAYAPRRHRVLDLVDDPQLPSNLTFCSTRSSAVDAGCSFAAMHARNLPFGDHRNECTEPQ